VALAAPARNKTNSLPGANGFFKRIATPTADT
jgi:hypothetical protein